MNKLIYSIYSGICYNIEEKLVTYLDDGQLTLKVLILKDCKKCYNRRYMGFDIQKFVYTPCSCIIKNADLHSIKEKFNIQS